MKILIVDDEPLSCNRIRRFLRAESDIESAQVANEGGQALAVIRADKPDIVFLDVQMPGLDGFQLLQQIPKEERPYIIFITAHENYAVQAFEVQALDYLLKPFSRRRFEDAMRRAREAKQRVVVQTETAVESAKSEEYAERLLLKESGEAKLLKTSDIDWIEADGRYVILHLQSRARLMREGINSLYSRLNPRIFLRIHRSYIVNIDRIEKLETWFHGEYRVVLRDGTRLMLTRSYKTRVQQLLGAKSL
jgi:two-component system, LytTR family, response regulator